MLLKELTKEPTVALTAYVNSILTSKRVMTSNIVATCVGLGSIRHIYHEISIYDCGCR